MQIQVLKQNGSNDSMVDLPEKIFGQPFNADLVHQLISTYIANGHQNTKGQKNRSAVRGEEENLGLKKEQEELEQELSDLQYGEAEELHSHINIKMLGQKK